MRMKIYACLAVFLMVVSGCGSGDKFDTDAPGIVVDFTVDVDLSKPVVQSKPVKPEAVEKDPSPIKTSPPKQTLLDPVNAELFSPDSKYRTLKRYEVPRRELVNIRNDSERESEIENVLEIPVAAEKSLVLGGRGLDVGGFENRSSDRLYISSKRQFEGARVPEREESRAGPIYIGDGMTPREKALVFHSRPGGYFKESKTSGEKEVLPAPAPAMRFTKKIPETRLLLAERPNKALKLRRKEDPMDLLVGHPDINRERYRNPD